MQALGVWPALQASWRLLRARPVVTLALGAAVVLSLISVCCGIGLFTTPWFMCELFALQIAQTNGGSSPRTLAWVPASLILLGAVLLVSAAAGLTLLGATPSLVISATQPLGWSLLARSTPFYALLSSVIAVLFILPFLFCPLILIEEGASFDTALLESARRVVAGGTLQHARLSLAAHGLQVAPALLVALTTALVDPSAVAVATLCATPLLCATVPLGQGMIVSAHVHARAEQLPHDEPAHDAAFSRVARVIRVGTFSWTLLMALPLVSLLLLGGSLARPSRLAVGLAPEAAVVAELQVRGAPAQRALLPGTALEVVASPRAVRVVASDGGGVGELPLRRAGAVEWVRVVRVRDAYAIEIHQHGTRAVLGMVDRAGVRLDDDLRVRLFDRVPVWGLLLVLSALLLTALLTLPALDGLARVRLRHALPASRRPAADLLALDLRRCLRHALLSAALLLPLSIAASVIAALAAFAA